MNNVLAKNIPAKEIFIRNKQAVNFIIKLIIAAGLLLFIIDKINPKEILNAISSSYYYLIIISFALCFLNLYLQFLKWETVCKNYLKIDSKKKIFLSLFHGFAAGIFTPARIGEYFSRGLALKEKSIFQIAAATFVDKFFSLLAVAFFGGISFIIYLNYFYSISPYTSILVFSLVAGIIYFLFHQIFKDAIFGFIPDKIKQKIWLQKLLLYFDNLGKLDHKFVLKMVFISAAFYFCYLIQFVILIAAFSHSLDFFKYLLNGSLIMFTKTVILQISVGELGIREGVSIYFFTKAGEAASTAFNASIFLFLINLAFPSLIGLILLYKKSND